MFEIALAIGIFSYSIFFLGLLGFIYPFVLIGTTLLFWGIFFWYKKEMILSFLQSFSPKHKSIFFQLAIIYLILQTVINSIGLFGPEIGFDATWYHLTLPKLYLLYHMIVHIPGGILYYSDMPKLTEMLYTVGLSFGSDFFARGIHFLFGIATLFALYRLGRKFFSPTWALLLPVIFYSNLVVGWESISGYIDLARTFFTVAALLAFFTWIETKKQQYFLYSAIFVAFTIGTKLLALPDIAVYTFVLLFLESNTLPLLLRIKQAGMFVGIVALCLLPWCVFSFIHTGNPIYPMLSPVYQVSDFWEILNPLFLLKSVWDTFAQASDPVHPIFLALLPFGIMYWKKLWKEFRLPFIFALGGLVAWYITPQTGGGRYILPYLSMLSVVAVFILTQLHKKWQTVFVVFIALVACWSLAYRSVANAKFLPLIFHKETEVHFMQKYLQFNLGDFYDIDGYFAHHIKPTDTVLLYGFHNLYYVDFPFIDSSWVKKGDAFNYVAVLGNGMPERFRYWTLIYFNPVSQVRVYSLKGQTWYY
ncbi:MAG TPA: hypothetical protein VLB73_01990 [Patescibacteria group bacterium]|nr:hypothetical protein [Patescibacteria group bacterium]